MLLWVSVAAMTAVAIAGVLWPLFRKRPARSGSDAAVYRDQLQEIDRDLGLGLIGAKEAEAARVEVSRRLLSAADQGGDVTSESGWSMQRSAVAALALVLLTAGSAALYLRLGTPSLAQPAAAAAPPEQTGIDKLVAQAEEYLTRNPQEVRGWEVLAPVYMRMGRYSDSANAWRNVLQLSGNNADRLANLGEALTAEANGIVTAEAKDAFVRSVALDPTTVTAQFYLGIAAEQDGKNSESAKIFRDLIAHAPADAHWVADVKTALARVDGKPDGAPVAKAEGSASGLPQDSSVRGMVDRLAARMKKDGSDPQGWVKLVQSYSVLNDAEKKQATIADARKALASDSDKLAKFESGLAALEKGEPLPSDVAAPPHSPTATAAAADASPGNDPSVRGMVGRLADRLKQDGGDVDGWIKLIRSYKVMKDDTAKTAATADARKALANDAAKLAKLETAIKAIDAGEEPPSPEPPPGGAAAGGPDHNADDMVKRLADRLQRSGSDPEGWLMLVRSYATLKEPDKQKEAIANARKALASEPAKLDAFNEAVKHFNLE
jgi:cytochrome c-type biogenesis protein CcmH